MKEFNILQTYEIFLKLIYLKLIQEYLNNENIGFTDETNAEEEKLFYTVTDIQGSITEVYDESSNLVWKSGYTAFGELAGETVDLIDFDGMYTGCDYDAETGLTYHWNRWRSEDGSSFISEDPARDGSNWYGYAGQNPMVYVDRIGLFYYTAEGQQSSTSNTPKTDKNNNSNKTPQNQGPNITGPSGMPESVLPIPRSRKFKEQANTEKEKSYIEEQNEIARYRTNIKTFDFYMKESLKISAEIGDLQKEIGKLKNENFELALDYAVQTVNDMMNLFSIFGEAVNVAKQQSYDVYSFCFNFALNIDIQNLAESVSDYKNEDRLTQKKVDQIMQKNNEQINYINQQIKGLNSTLRSYEREKEKIKKELSRKKEYWEND